MHDVAFSVCVRFVLVFYPQNVRLSSAALGSYGAGSSPGSAHFHQPSWAFLPAQAQCELSQRLRQRTQASQGDFCPVLTLDLLS